MPGACDGEGDDVGDVLGCDGQPLVQLLGGLLRARIGDVLGQFGGDGTGFDQDDADVGLQLLARATDPR